MRNFIGVVIAVGAFGPRLAAQGTVPGWYEESRLVTTHTGSDALPGSDRLGRTWHAGAKTRTEWLTTSRGRRDDTYSVVIDTTHTTYFVSPSAKTIRVIRYGDLARDNLAARDSAARIVPRYANLGPGEPIIGHATKRYRASWSLPMTAFGETTPRTVKYTRTVWLATDSAVPAIRRAMPTTLPKNGSNLPRGVVLRSEVVVEGLRSAGGTSTIRSEVVALRTADIEVSLFTLPAGYKRIAMADEMRGAATLQKVQAMQAVQARLKRLMASSDPKDKARARVLGDSFLRATRPDSARLKELMRNDPNTVRITDTVPARKKP